MMKYICNHCGKATYMYRQEIGWIHIGDYGIQITDEEYPDGSSNVQRFTSVLLSTAEGGLDFCSIECFIQWLYFSDETQCYQSNINNKDQALAFAMKIGIPYKPKKEVKKA